jgi:hypothetical protein
VMTASSFFMINAYFSEVRSSRAGLRKLRPEVPLSGAKLD